MNTTTVTRSYPDVPGYIDGGLGAVILQDPVMGDALADAQSPPLRCGYGACSKCNCRGFEGNNSTCANSGCGHAYSDHW
jgi:hypothetical protein